MEAMKYVEIARSTNKNCSNLLEVYRDKTEIVATDNHRLHWSNHLPEIEPHYLSGLNAEFPDWRRVLPRVDLIATAEIGLLAGVKGKLDGLLKCLKVGDNHNRVFVRFIPVEGDLPARCEIKTTQLDGMEVFLEFYIITCTQQFDFNVNAKYFIEALAPLIQSRDSSAAAEIKFYGSHFPILIDYQGKLDNLHAVVMPLR